MWGMLEGDAQKSKSYCGLFSTPELAKETALLSWKPDSELTWEAVQNIGENGGWKLTFEYRALAKPILMEFWILSVTVDYFVKRD